MSNPRARTGLLAALLMAAGIALAGCDDDGGGGQGSGEQAPPTVSVAGVAGREITQLTTYVGQVRAVDEAGMTARVEGFLNEILVPDGAVVDQDQPLFRIERDSYEAALAQAEADLAEAEANLALSEIELERDRRLLESGTIAQSRFDATLAARERDRALVAAREAQLREARLRLSYTEMRAPFSGRIGDIAFSEGDVVGPSTGPITTLVSLAPVDVSFSVNESDFVAFLRRIGAAGGDLWRLIEADEGPAVRLILPGGDRFEEEGRIVFADNRVDPETGTIALRARFENASQILTPGIFVTVEILERESARRLLVPQVAVQRDQKGDFVLVVGPEGMVQQRHVRLGRQVGTDFIVEEGLQEGESVIVEGLQRVRPGVPVRTASSSDGPGEGDAGGGDASSGG